MKCCIVKDLLPNYIDGLTSKETNTEIEKHLADCVECHLIYEQMSSKLPEEIKPEEKDIDFLKKMKARMRQNYTFVIISTCVVILYLLVVISGMGVDRMFNYMDSTTLMFVLFPSVLTLFYTKSYKAFGNAFLFAFGKKTDSADSYKESLQAVKMVMVTSSVFGCLGFMIGMFNSIRSKDFASPEALHWVLQDLTVAMLSLLYPLLICVILLPVWFILKKHMSR